MDFYDTLGFINNNSLRPCDFYNEVRCLVELEHMKFNLSLSRTHSFSDRSFVPFPLETHNERSSVIAEISSC